MGAQASEVCRIAAKSIPPCDQLLRISYPDLSSPAAAVTTTEVRAAAVTTTEVRAAAVTTTAVTAAGVTTTAVTAAIASTSTEVTAAAAGAAAVAVAEYGHRDGGSGQSGQGAEAVHPDPPPVRSWAGGQG